MILDQRTRVKRESLSATQQRVCVLNSSSTPAQLPHHRPVL
jgi:hypothetical protein